jgi:2-methylisocitrate lyase-like PEP mutase family enzyme
MAPAERLQALGARRLSSGARPFRAAYAALNTAMAAYLASGDAAALAQLDVGLQDFNPRFG